MSEAEAQLEQRSSRVWKRFDTRQRVKQILVILFAAAVFMYSWRELNIRYEFIWSAPREFQDLFTRMYPPNLGYAAEITWPMIETIHIAVLGTIFALIISAPTALLAAENTTPNKVTLFIGKFIVAGSRSVNTIIWALIFVIIFGSGALSGVLAITVRSIGMCGKLLGEEIEEIDFGQTEAIQATGGNVIDVMIYGIVPQIKPAFVGIATYRWDINVRGSTILGFVGAGGIGAELLHSVNGFRWPSVFTILIAILVIVIFSESFSAWARKKVR